MRPISLWYLWACLCLVLLLLVLAPQIQQPVSARSLSAIPIRFGEFLSARIAMSGEVQAFTFDGRPGEVITLVLENQTSGVVDLALYDPAGILMGRSSGEGDRELVNVGLIVPGAYAVEITGEDGAVGDVALGLFSNASLSVLAPTTIGAGQVVARQFAVEGAYALFSIPGTSNEVLTLFVDNRLNGGLEIRLFAPDGRQMAARGNADVGEDLLLEHQLLPSTGNYLMLINPHGASTGDLVLVAYAGTEYSRVVPTVIDAGEPRSGTLTLGEQALLRFAGKAGQRVVVHADHWLGGSFYLRLFDPRGGQVASRLVPAGSGLAFLETTLPLDGDYLVVFDPHRDVVGGYAVALYSTPAGVAPKPALIEAGERQSGSLTAAGQHALYAFDSAADREITLAVNNRLGDGVTLLLVSPAGDVVAYGKSTSAGDDLLLRAYTPQSGRYLVVVAPHHGAVGRYSLALYSRPSETVGAARLDYGDTIIGSARDADDHEIYRFDGRAGETVTVFADNSLDGGLDLRLFDPNGQLIASEQGSTRGESAVLENVVLPADGGYLIAVDPLDEATGEWDVTIYNAATTDHIVPAPLAYGLTADGSVTRPRNQAFYRFDGEAGDLVSLTLQHSFPDGLVARLIAPTGEQLAARLTADSPLALEDVKLPVAGHYLVVVDPLHAATGSFSLQVRRSGVEAVSPGPTDFQVAASPSCRWAARGESVSYDIGLAPRGGFAGPVTVQFDPTSTPPNASVYLEASTVTLPASLTLTVYVGAATPRGEYVLRLVVTSGEAQTVVPLSLRVLGRLDWVVTPPITQVAAGQGVAYRGAVAHADGGSGTVVFTADPATLPPDTRIRFEPTVLSEETGQTVATIRTAPTTPPGDYTIMLRATVDGNLQAIRPVILRVRPLTTAVGHLVFMPVARWSP